MTYIPIAQAPVSVANGITCPKDAHPFFIENGEGYFYNVNTMVYIYVWAYDNTVWGKDVRFNSSKLAGPFKSKEHALQWCRETLSPGKKKEGTNNE